MSFFVPNWAVALSLLLPADPGGRLSLPQSFTYTEVCVTSGAASPPSSAALAGKTAWASSVSKKGIHIPVSNIVSELDQSSHYTIGRQRKP